MEKVQWNSINKKWNGIEQQKIGKKIMHLPQMPHLEKFKIS